MYEPSSMTLYHQLPQYTVVCPSGGKQDSRKITNSLSLADRISRNMVWTHPYAHPQHVKVVKHLVCWTLMYEPSCMAL